jgi:hypothetical protein
VKNKVKQQYRLKTFRADGTLKSETRWRENLVLDTGLTALANGTGTAGFFSQASLGSSNAANQISSSPVTFTQSGTAITASGSFFTSNMTGALLKYGTGAGGAEVYLTYVDATHATASVSMTVGSATVATVYFVAQTKLTTWTDNFARYNPVGNLTTKLYSGGVATVTHQREFVFNAGPTTSVNEIGWGTDNSSNPNIFGRAVLPSPVSRTAMDYIVLTIQIIITLNPAAPVLTSQGSQLFNQYKGTATYAPTFAMEVWATTTVNSDGSTNNTNAILDAFNNNFYIWVITDNSFAQNVNVGNTPPACAYFYSHFIGGYSQWNQVAGQLPGVTQITAVNCNFTTAGEKLIGVGVASDNTHDLAWDIIPNWSNFSLVTALPTGNFQISCNWQMNWVRELSN